MRSGESPVERTRGLNRRQLSPLECNQLDGGPHPSPPMHVCRCSDRSMSRFRRVSLQVETKVQTLLS